MKKILLVCTGNTCRSPMAEALFKDIIEERYDLENEFLVSSAGVYAFEGDPASFEAVNVMKDAYGIDITSHRAKVLDVDDIKDAYLILTMTEHQKKMIIDIYPKAADKVFSLKDYAEVEDEENNLDISDPFGKDIDTYKACALEIEELLMETIGRI